MSFEECWPSAQSGAGGAKGLASNPDRGLESRFRLSAGSLWGERT
jgi:hypothetical protein